MIAARALAAALCVAAALFACHPAAAATGARKTIIIRAGTADSPTHAMALDFAQAIAVAENGAYTLDVQESQGSVDNVAEAAKRKGNYVFTASASVIARARHGDKPFLPNWRYKQIRALFPLPPLAVQWMVRQDSGVRSLADLAGGSLIPGPRGSVSERLTTAALQQLGIDGQVQLIDINLAAAPAALKAKQVTGLALAGAYPVPSLVKLAQDIPMRLISLPLPDLAAILRADDSTTSEIVPKGTYPGTDEDVSVLAVSAGAYTTTRMPAAVAYALVKAFWSRHAALVQRSPPWQAVDDAALATLGVKLHKGALRYYDEAKIKVPENLR